MKLLTTALRYDIPWTLPDVYLFTGNPIRRSDGAIVMGRGTAKQVRDLYPRVPFELAVDKDTLLTFTRITATQHIGWFKVKHHWRDAADIDLISASAVELARWAREFFHLKYHINAPGIGNGRLKWQDVQQVLEILPDNVLIYKL